MLIDDLDIEIINNFYKLKKSEAVNYYRMVGKIYPNLNDYEKRKKYRSVRNKIDKLTEYQILVRKEKLLNEIIEIIFELQMQNVHFKKIKFNDKICNAVCLKIEGIWCAFQLK